MYKRHFLLCTFIVVANSNSSQLNTNKLGTNQLGSNELGTKEQVVICVPIADCMGVSAQELNPDVQVEQVYHDLPYSPEKGHYSCPRIHQCLFNEVGTVCKKTDHELLVEFPHFYFIANDKKCSRMWLASDSVVSLATEGIPEPLSYKAPNVHDEGVLTLLKPWHDTSTGITYSVGTRFCRDPSSDDLSSYGIKRMNYNDLVLETVSLPKEYGLLSGPHKEAKELFVQILRSWVSDDEKAVPYVWGGCSYTECLNEEDFELSNEWRGSEELSCWRRPSGSVPHAGFDCSCLILRAAQIAGIRYFCKNTTTIRKCLESVPDNEPLEEGDLMLMGGHVMIISDLNKNKLIDAYAYSAGYGCMREVTLNMTFNDIDTYKQLRESVRQGKALSLLDKEGEHSRTLSFLEFKRLKDHD